MNNYVSLGSYDDVHKKIDYKIYAPNSLQNYLSSFNSSLFSQVDNERERIEQISQTNDPNTRFGYRFDSNFPLKRIESTYVPHSLTNFGSAAKPCINGKCTLEGFEDLHEVAKQTVLLEDQLFNQNKRSKEGITKRCLTIEGYLEEAVTLDNNLEYIQSVQGLLKEFRDISQEIFSTLRADIDMREDRWIQIAQKLRQFRQPICQKYASNL